MFDLRVALGLRIEELRTSLQMTRAELAKLVGVQERTIINYELYGTWPKPERVVRLAKGLGVQIHDLFDFTETRKRQELSFKQRLASRGGRSDRGITRRPPRRAAD